MVQFCFKGNPGLNQGTKFIGVGGRTGKHFVLVAGQLSSRSDGIRLKEELVFFFNKLQSGKSQAYYQLCRNKVKVRVHEFRKFLE